MSASAPTDQETLDALLRQNQLAFTWKAFHMLHGAPPRMQEHLRLFAAAFEAVWTGETRRLVVNAPPRSLKSFVLLICAAAWVLGHDPRAQVMIVCNDEKLCTLHANKVRQILQSDWYQRLWPSTRIDPNHNRAGDFMTTLGGGVLARSMEASTTGHGADWIFIDDPHDAGDVASAPARQRAYDLIVNKFYQRLNAKATGRILVIMQRLHPDDVAGRLQSYRRLVVPLIQESDTTYEIGSYRWDRKAGDVLDPQAYGDVAELRESMPLHTFLTQYQQDAVAAGAGMLKESHFSSYAELPPLRYDTFLSFDLNAGSTEPGASYSCMMVVCRHQLNLYVVEVWRGRLDFEPLKTKALELIMRYPNNPILIENTALGTAMISSLKALNHRAIAVAKPTKSKQERVSAVFDVFADRRIHLPDYEPWRAAFLEEMLLFPGGAYDDQVDALVQLVTWLKTGPNAPIANPVIGGVAPTRLAAGSTDLRDRNRNHSNMMPRPGFKGPGRSPARPGLRKPRR